MSRQRSVRKCYSSFSHNSHKVEKTWKSTDRLMNKHIMAYLCNETLLSNKYKLLILQATSIWKAEKKQPEGNVGLVSSLKDETKIWELSMVVCVVFCFFLFCRKKSTLNIRVNIKKPLNKLETEPYYTLCCQVFLRFTFNTSIAISA